MKAPTDIDRFLAAKLAARGLRAVKAADRRTLIRRATYDLTGLPPTAEEVDAFEHDRSPEAFAKVVDRLLASPRYGERMGRVWLDVARYSDDRLDSERDNPYPASFRYRDWVIQAMQNDMPYDVFVKAQIAGDQLPDREKYQAALGFYALSPEMQDDRVDATSRGFLGLTVACAQCHDHKYDPIPTRDFYSLMGIFRNTNLHEVPLAPKEIVDAYKKQEALIQKKEKELKEFVDAQSAQLGLVLASQTARYMQGSAKLDPETQARWKKYLASPEKQHPFLKDWFAAKTDDQRAKAAAEFQDRVLAVIAEKNRVDDENHIRLGIDPSRDDLSKANLVSLDRAKFGLWEDMLGDQRRTALRGFEEGRSEDRPLLVRRLAGSFEPTARAVGRLEEGSSAGVSGAADYRRQGEASGTTRLDSRRSEQSRRSRAAAFSGHPVSWGAETLRSRQGAPGTGRGHREPFESSNRPRDRESSLAAAFRIRHRADAQ